MRALRYVLALLALKLLIGGAIAWVYFERPGMEAYAAHHHAAPAAADPSPHALTATWLGTATLLLSDGEHSVMVDPFFTRPRGLLNLALNRKIKPDEEQIARGLTRAHLKNLVAVLVSHSHYDHAMDAGVVARLGGALLMGSESTANIGRGSGVPESQIVVIKPRQNISIGSFKITFLESRHTGATGGRPAGDIAQPLRPPARYLDYKEGGTYSILIEHPLGTVLHHGSAGFIPGALEGRRADVVFLGIAFLDDPAAYLHEVVDAVGAKRAIPVHWDDFTRPLDEPLVPFPVVVHLDRFFDDMARLRPDIEVETLNAGEPAVLFAPK